MNGIPSVGNPGATVGDYPVHAWLIGEKDTGTQEYIQRALRAEKSEGFNDFARIYRQDPARFLPTINDEPCAQLWVTFHQMDGMAPKARASAYLDFLLNVRRWFGSENGNLRVKKTPEQLGLVRHECEFEGRYRYWHVYVPSLHKRDPARPLPLVMAVRGYSCTGELFAEISEWHALAEENGFFVVYPTAYPGITTGNCTPLPMWRNGPAEWGLQNDVDDVAYLDYIIGETQKGYPVDRSRIYATGHSNGSVMVQILMNAIPERFAAVSPVGLTHGDLGILPFTKVPDVPVPVWSIKRELDISCACDFSPGSPNERLTGLFRRQNRVTNEAAREHQCGRYRTMTWYDGEHWPIIRFTEVAGLPHAYTPEIARITWSEFFCHFARNEDQSITYLG